MSVICHFDLSQNHTLRYGIGPFGSLLLSLINQPLGCTREILFVEAQSPTALIMSKIPVEALIELLGQLLIKGLFGMIFVLAVGDIKFVKNILKKFQHILFWAFLLLSLGPLLSSALFFIFRLR